MESATTKPAAIQVPAADATNGELVRWAFAQINQHDVTPLRDMWEGTVEYFPGLICTGPDEISKYFNDLFAAVPDLKLEIQGFAEAGEDVFVRWQLTGHFSGATYQGVASTGTALEIDGCDHFVIRDGRVITNHVVSDQMAFARQIGMLPPDGTLPDRALKGAFNLKTLVVSKLRRN
ncbi:MAG: ester cyclase [Thermoleophilaceae bacterium]|nr:ester cyclase [Thermoleophilaceae bacterium]